MKHSVFLLTSLFVLFSFDNLSSAFSLDADVDEFQAINKVRFSFFPIMILFTLAFLNDIFITVK
jgi:hypothetical protein